MATEINIQESVFLKKDEREDQNALTSESFEEKITELPGNIMKQLETSSLVAETVNTPLETGKPTDESGTFFQALSVPVVIADEHSNEPESCKAAKKTEPEEETVVNEENAIESQVCDKDVPQKGEDEVGSKLFDSLAPSKKDDVSMLEKNQGDSDGVTSSLDVATEEIIKETTTKQEATTVADSKEQDLNETLREFDKEETEDKSVISQEASEKCDIGSKDIEEQKSEETIKKIEQDEEVEEIKPGVEMEEKKEKNGLLQAITSDEQKDEDVIVLKEDQDNDDITSAQEAAFERDLQEKNHHNEDIEQQVVEAKGSIKEDTDVGVSTQTELVEESIKNEETNDEKAIEKEVCDESGSKKAEFEEGLVISDSVEPSQKDEGDSDGVTSSQEAPCVAVKETTDEHVTTVIDFEEKDLNEKPKEFIVEETADKPLDAQEAIEDCQNAKEEIEQDPEESVKKIEKEEETEESVTSDAFISTQTKSQVEKTEHEETGSEKVEYEKEVTDSAVAIINKDVIEDEDEEKDQGVKVLEQDEGEDGVTSAQDKAFEKDLQEKNHLNEDDESEVVTAEESIEKDSDNIRSFEKTDQQMQIDSVPSDVCISTQTEPEEEIADKNDEEAIEDDGQTNKSATSILKEIGEENVTEKTEPEEGLKHPDSSSMALNENETLKGGEDQEKEQVIEEAEDKLVDAQEETEQYEDRVEKEQKLEERVDEYDDGDKVEKEQKLEERVDETALSYSKNDQEEYAEEIEPSVVATEEKDVCISTEIESQEEATKNEEKDNISDGDLKDKSDNPFVKEVCEENDLKKTEFEEEIQLSDSHIVKTRDSVNAETEEGVKLSDDFSTTLNENELLRKEETLGNEAEIKAPGVQGSGDDVTSSKSASNEDIKETTISQHDTTVAYVEEAQGVTATPKEVLIEEAVDKSIDAQEISLELGQPNQQYVEETIPSLSKTISENQEDEIKKEDKGLSHDRVEDTNDNTTKEEQCTPEQELVEEQSSHDEVSKDKVTDLIKTTNVEPQEVSTTFTSLETSTKDTLKLEKEKEESENLPIEDLETDTHVQIPELVPKPEDSTLKEKCFNSETETHLDEEKGIVAKEISSDEKTEVQGDGYDVTSSHNASNDDIQETTIGQHDTTVADVEEGQGVSATPKEILIEEAEGKLIDVEEPGQSNEQNVEETHVSSKTLNENPKDEIKKEDTDLSFESVEDTNDNTTKEEKCIIEQESVEELSDQVEVSKEKEKVTDIIETTEDTSNLEKEKTESENFPVEIETVSEQQIPESVPKLEESELKEECFISETETHSDKENEIAAKEISSDEKTKVQGGEDDVPSSKNTSSEDMQETMIDHHDATVAYIEEGEGLRETSKEILTEETQHKSIDAEESNEEHVEESKTLSKNPEVEIKKEDKDLPHESVEDTNDTATKGEKCTLEQEPVEEHTSQEEVSKEKVIDLNETTEVEPQEDITPSTSLEISTEDTSNSEKEKAESKVENLETVSEVQIPELVSKSEELMLKEERLISETITQSDEEKGTVTKEILINEKTEQTTKIKQEDVKKETEQYDDGANDEREHEPEEHIDEIKTTAETKEEKDVYISTQIESPEEDTKNEELAIGIDGHQKEKLDDPFVDEVSNENDLKNTAFDEEKQLSDSSIIKSRESVVEDTEEPKSRDDTKENVEQQGLLHAITTDVDTKTTEGEENNDEETIKNDDVQTEKLKSPLVDSVCETTSSEMAESGEGVKQSDSFSTTLNESETLSNEEKLEKEDEIKALEVQVNIKETTISQHDTTVAYVEEGQGESTMPKEILTEEAENKSIDAEKMSLELGHPDKQSVEETYPCLSKTISENPEEEIKKQDKDLSPENVEDRYDTTKKEECTSNQELVEDHSGRDEVSKEYTTDLNETTEVGPQEDITHFNPLEQSTEDTSNSEKEKAESENLPIEDLETVSEVEISELVAKSEESVLKDEFISETETHLDEEKETIMKEISSDEKKEQATDIKQETVKEICEDISLGKTEFEEELKLSDSSNIIINEEVITTLTPSEQEKDQEVNTLEESQGEDNILKKHVNQVSKELGQPEEQNVEEIQACLTETISEKTEDEITKKDEETLEHEPVEEQNDSQHKVSGGKFTDLNETTAVAPQEDVMPTSNLNKEKAESENLIIEDLESVSEVNIPEVKPKSENSDKATASVDEENDTLKKENSSDENLETHGSTQQPDNSYNTKEEDITQLEQIGEINSLDEIRDLEEDVTQESQLSSSEDCSETVKDVILTEEIKQVPREIEKEKDIIDFKEQTVEEESYSSKLEENSVENKNEIVHEISNLDSKPVENPEVTEVNVDAKIGQEALQGEEEISCVSRVTNGVDQEPMEEIISSQVDSTKTESTAYPAESEKIATRALEFDCDVQIPEVVADSDDSKVKEEYVVLATAEYIDGNNVEEQDIKTNDSSSAPIKSDEAKSSDLIIEEKAITKENLEVHEELEPASEPAIEDQVTKAKPLPEQSDITSENITSDQTLESKLEHTSGKDLEDVQKDIEEDVTLAPENEIKSIEIQNETTKNTILTDEAVVDTEKENKSEIGQVSKDDIYHTKLDNELPVGNTEVMEAKLENSVEDTEDPELTPENLSVKDETFTVAKGPIEDSETIASEFEKLESTVTEENIIKADSNKETVTLDEPRIDDTLQSQNEKNTEDPVVLPSVEKDVIEGVDKSFEDALVIDFQKHEKDLDNETEVRIADVVSNAECLENEPLRLGTKNETLEFINQENQIEHEKEADESIEVVVPVEDVKTSTRELEVGNVDLEVPSVKDATADKADNKTVEVQAAERGLLKDKEHLESIHDQSKPLEEGSEIKQEPLNLDATGTLSTTESKDLKISQKSVTDDLIKTSQTHPEIQKYEVPASVVDKQSPNGPHPIDSSLEQGEPVAKSLAPEAENLKADKASGTEPQGSNTGFIDQKETCESVEPAKFEMTDVLHEPTKGNSEGAGNLIGERDLNLTKDQQVETEEIGESGVKTDEEDNEDDEKMGSGSDAPVMVEASKDMDVKVHKKSHNILSGVGSKVKHSIAKVKKAITGKSSPPKSASPKANNQVVG